MNISQIVDYKRELKFKHATSSREAVNAKFYIVFGFSRSKIKSESIVSVADVLSAQALCNKNRRIFRRYYSVILKYGSFFYYGFKLFYSKMSVLLAWARFSKFCLFVKEKIGDLRKRARFSVVFQC